MDKKFIKKNVNLSMEFDVYLSKHPELYKKIPNGAYVVIQVNGDESFNKQSIATVRNIRTKKVIEAQKVSRGWRLQPATLNFAA